MRDDIMTEIRTLLRTVLPDDAAEITLYGEADENFARVSFGMRRPDGTEFLFARDDNPREEASEMSDLLIDLWEATEDDGGDRWHSVDLTVRRDGTSEIAFSPDFPASEDDEDDEDELPEPEELITELAELLRDILTADATEIILEGEVDEDWSSHTIRLRRADGTSFTFGRDDTPESTKNVADILADLWDSTFEHDDETWYGITMTVRRDDTYEVTFLDEPPVLD